MKCCIIDKIDKSARLLFSPNVKVDLMNPKTSRSVSPRFLALALLAMVLLPVSSGTADLLSIYLSDGILRDCAILDGDTVAIDTGKTPPEFVVDSVPFGFDIR